MCGAHFVELGVDKFLTVYYVKRMRELGMYLCGSDWEKMGCCAHGDELIIP